MLEMVQQSKAQEEHQNTFNNFWTISNPAMGFVEFAAASEVAWIDASCYRQPLNAPVAVLVVRP